MQTVKGLYSDISTGDKAGEYHFEDVYILNKSMAPDSSLCFAFFVFFLIIGPVFSMSLLF
jgi:hypothetical protein